MQFEQINLKFPKFTTLGGPPKQFEITRKRTHSELIENSERLRETHRCSLTLIERSRCLKSPSTSQLRNLQKIFESSNLNQQSYFDSWQVCLYSKLPVLLFYLCSLCPCNIKVINISFDMFRCNKRNSSNDVNSKENIVSNPVNKQKIENLGNNSICLFFCSPVRMTS